jgi:hypothetical protein
VKAPYENVSHRVVSATSETPGGDPGVSVVVDQWTVNVSSTLLAFISELAAFRISAT